MSVAIRVLALLLLPAAVVPARAETCYPGLGLPCEAGSRTGSRIGIGPAPTAPDETPDDGSENARPTPPAVPQTAQSYDLPAIGVSVARAEGGGLIVTAVAEGSAAAGTGVAVDDVILTVGDAPVDSPDALAGALEATRESGRERALLTVRRGERMTFLALSVRAGEAGATAAPGGVALTDPDTLFLHGFLNSYYREVVAPTPALARFYAPSVALDGEEREAADLVKIHDLVAFGHPERRFEIVPQTVRAEPLDEARSRFKLSWQVRETRVSEGRPEIGAWAAVAEVERHEDSFRFRRIDTRSLQQ